MTHQCKIACKKPSLHIFCVTVTQFKKDIFCSEVATGLQTNCNKSVHKLLTRCIRTACFEFVGTSLEQAVDKL